MFRLADEAEGLQFEPSESPLEAAARWVQWAEASATTNTQDWGTKNQNTRYNLGQFWILKGDHYAEDPAAWDRLDLRAHKAWAAISELGMVADNPPAQKKYQDEAQQAYAGAKSIAARLGQSTSTLDRNSQSSSAWYAEAQTHGVDDRLSVALADRANELLEEANAIFGIPLWVWGIGAVAVLYLLYGRK